MAYIYQAELWCNDCGRDICRRIKNEGKAPPDPWDQGLYDSDDYPKHVGDPGPADAPDHCAARGDCLNAVDLGDYYLPPDAKFHGSESRKVGALLSTRLTPDGRAYVRDTLATGPRTAFQAALHALWASKFLD